VLLAGQAGDLALQGIAGCCRAAESQSQTQ
jgi:hypothetical protein